MEQVNFKVFLYSENEDQCLEVQKFYLSPTELCIYDLKEKLDILFKNQSFKIFWKKDHMEKRQTMECEAEFQICLAAHQTQGQTQNQPQDQNMDKTIRLILVKTHELANEWIWMQIKGLNDTQSNIVVKYSESFGELMERYKSHTGNSQFTNFKYQGMILRNEQTPLSMGMQHSAEIKPVFANVDEILSDELSLRRKKRIEMTEERRRINGKIQQLLSELESNIMDGIIMDGMMTYDSFFEAILTMEPWFFQFLMINQQPPNSTEPH